MGQSAHDIPGADPAVQETINGLLSDDPKGFLDKRAAEELEDIQKETRERQSKYYDELRKHGVGRRVLASLTGRSTDDVTDVSAKRRDTGSGATRKRSASR